MRKRATVIAALLLAGLALVAFVARSREPRYQHHSLSYWTSLYLTTSAVQHERADDAIRHIGTNGLPYLIDWFQYDPLQRLARTYEVYLKLPRLVRTNDLLVRLYHHDPRYVRAITALIALEALGPDAAPAAPELVSVLETNTWLAQRAANVLVGIGPPAVPALITAATNTYNPHRYDLIRSIDALGTNGGFAVPVLTSLLQDPDEGIRLNAKATLFEITNDTRRYVNGRENEFGWDRLR